MSWAVTAALADLSDLYKETVSEDKKQYRVDGEWRNLESRREYIKVKGEDKPYVLDVKSSHRGPLMSNEILSGAEVLFSESTPAFDNDTYYSLAWTGHVKQDNTIAMIRSMTTAKSV